MMTEQTNRNYYAIIPANVRYDKTLTANAKLLYGEITALTNDKGYCWASNGYFAELYEVSKETISRWISILEKNGYVNTQIIYRDNSKEILERRIYIIGIPQVVSEKTFVKNDDIINTPIDENNKTYSLSSPKMFEHIRNRYVHLSSHYAGLDTLGHKDGDHHFSGDLLFINRPVKYKEDENGKIFYEREIYK